MAVKIGINGFGRIGRLVLRGLLKDPRFQVLVVNEGEIIERGTHEGLLEKRGFYHRLYVSQFKGQVQPGG